MDLLVTIILVFFNSCIFSFQFYFPCDSWRDISETPAEGISERFRRKAPQEPAEGNNVEEN
jgi:hypothetical protein